MSNSNNLDIENIDDEIDLRNIFEIIKRNKSIIFKSSLFGLIISILLGFVSRKTWQGNFQIVINNDVSSSKASPLAMNSSRLSSLAGLQTNNQIKTEVGILESPSVLLQIFEYVKTEKKAKKDNSLGRIKFKKWRDKYLDINLVKGTTILDLTYRDKDKELIVPVLNKISSSYQEYATNRKQRKLKLSLDFYMKQVALYDKKNKESLKNSQQFLSKYDLDVDVSEGTSIRPNMGNSGSRKVKVNVDPIRIAAAEKIRFLDQYLDQIQSSQSNDEEIIAVAKKIPLFNQSNGSIQRINQINNSLAKRRVIFLESDDSIQDLLEEKRNLVESIKKELLSHLFAEKSEAISKLESSKRPEGVIIKAIQYATEAEKNKNTLSELEQELRMVQLEKAKYEDPWKLITNPTLLPKPIYPNKLQFGIFGLISGCILGISLGLFKERKEGVIYSKRNLQRIVSWNPLATISMDKSSFKENLILFGQGFLRNTSDSKAILLVGDFGDDLIKEINFYLDDFKKDNLSILANFVDLASYENFIVFCLFSKTKGKDINSLNEKLLLIKKNPLGVVFLDNVEYVE